VPLAFDPERESKLADAFCPVPCSIDWHAAKDITAIAPIVKEIPLIITCLLLFILLKKRSCLILTKTLFKQNKDLIPSNYINSLIYWQRE
jgi:hypothetical protein